MRPFRIAEAHFRVSDKKDYVNYVATAPPIPGVQVSWRRVLVKEDASTPYGKERGMVVPDIKNKNHYGSSEDPKPSDEDLAKLSE